MRIISYFHYCTLGGPGKPEFKTEEILSETSAKACKKLKFTLNQKIKREEEMAEEI